MGKRVQKVQSGIHEFKSESRLQGILTDRGLRTFPTHVMLEEWFLQKPALNAVLALAGAGGDSAATLTAYTIANKNFEVLGTNMTTALATFATTGGVTLSTAGASGDQAILTPHLDTDQTLWTATKWNTGKQIVMDAWIKTHSSVAATKLWAGFKLTNTPTVATDDNQAFFRYEAGVNSGCWQFISSRAGTDTTTSLEGASTRITVTASTIYRLTIEVDAARRVMAYINGQKAFRTPLAALTDNIDLIPYIGVESAAVATKAVTVLPPFRCGRLAA